MADTELMDALEWSRTGDDTLDAGTYRVLRKQMISEDRPSYYRFTAFAGKDLLGSRDTGKECQALCDAHNKSRLSA